MAFAANLLHSAYLLGSVGDVESKIETRQNAERSGSVDHIAIGQF